jgi:hypothetical protein
MGFAGGVGRHPKHPSYVRPGFIVLMAHLQNRQFLFIEDLERFLVYQLGSKVEIGKP